MKRNIILLAIIALIFSGCRKEADYHPYIGENGILAYDSYSTQFEYLWKVMSTAYVFWDIDTVDWDARYEEYSGVQAAHFPLNKSEKVDRNELKKRL